MNMGVSSFRPLQDHSLQDLNAIPTDFSSLSGKHGQHNALSGNGSGNQAIDPSTLLFANPVQSQVNFGPPDQDTQTSPANAASGNGNNNQTNLVQQLMTLVVELLQMLMQLQNGNKPNAQNGSGDSGDSGGGGGVDGSGGSGGGGGGGAVNNTGSGDGDVSTPGNSAANAVSGDTSLSGSGDLHLPKQLEAYRDDIMDASKATGVPPSILAGQIWAESRGQLGQDTTNVNGKTDAGVMQVNADTFAQLKKDNPDLLGNANVNNARDNIMAGALYMRDQHQAFGDWGSALRAYNSGPDKVNKGDLSSVGGVGDPNYVKNVMNFAQIIESGQGQLPA